MFLSQLRLHPRDPLVLRDLSDPTELHRSLMRAFPQHQGPSPRAHFGVLFRVESEPAGGGAPTLLVQSTVKPSWDALPEGYVLACEVKDVAGLLDGIAAGAAFRFRLVANPTKKVAPAAVGATPRRHNPRVPLLGEEERLAWLSRKGAQFGFVVPPGGVRSSVLGVSGGRGATAVRVQPVQFEGELRVVEPLAFRDALSGGVGPAKAYGCGLLSLAPTAL